MSLFAKKNTPSPRRRQPQAPKTPRVSSDSLDQRYSFRRNRTLTGSLSAGVTSAGPSDKAQLKSSRVQAHDLARHRRNIGVILLGVVLASVILYLLVSQLTAKVAVRTATPMSIDAQRYQQSIDTYLQARPIERMRFMLNQDRLNAYVQTVNPEVASVTVDGMSEIGGTAFMLTFRQPIAGWSIAGSNQYVDTSGTSFTRNYFDAPKVQIVDKSGIQIAAGQAVASDQFLGFVGRMVGAVGAQGYVVKKVTIPRSTTRQVEVRLAGVSYPIKVSVDRPTGEQSEDMVRSIRWMKKNGISPKQLDVRVSGRAFYR